MTRQRSSRPQQRRTVLHGGLAFAAAGRAALGLRRQRADDTPSVTGKQIRRTTMSTLHQGRHGFLHRLGQGKRSSPSRWPLSADTGTANAVFSWRGLTGHRSRTVAATAGHPNDLGRHGYLRGRQAPLWSRISTLKTPISVGIRPAAANGSLCRPVRGEDRVAKAPIITRSHRHGQLPTPGGTPIEVFDSFPAGMATRPFYPISLRAVLPASNRQREILRGSSTTGGVQGMMAAPKLTMTASRFLGNRPHPRT